MEVAHRNIVENLICMQICPLAILYCEVLMQSHRAALMDYQDFQPGTECTTWMYHPALPHKHSHLPSAPTGSCLHTCIFKMTTCCWLYVPALSPDHSSYKITFSNCSYAKTKIHILNINIFTSLNSLAFISLSQKQTNQKHPSPHSLAKLCSEIHPEPWYLSVVRGVCSASPSSSSIPPDMEREAAVTLITAGSISRCLSLAPTSFPLWFIVLSSCSCR